LITMTPDLRSFSCIALAVVSFACSSCEEPKGKTNAEPRVPSPPPTSGVDSPPPSIPSAAPSAAPGPAKGTRTVLAERKVDDSWDKMIVAGGRLYVVTEVNKWTSGPMYVPASQLWSVPISGGALERHLKLEGLASLAADESALYVAVNRDLSTMSTSRASSPTGRIFRLPLGGGAPADLAKGIAPTIFAVDGDTIWFDGFRMPKDGKKPPVSSGAKGVLAFAFDADNVYFTSGKGGGEPVKPGNKNGRILRMPKAGGAPVVLASGLPDEPSGLAVDATHVYVSAVAYGSEALENAAVIARVPKQGGDLEILAKDQALLRAAWLSGDHVYVRSGRPGRPGAIRRILKTGGNVETVLEDATFAHATMDETSIYFSSDGSFRADTHERTAPATIVRFVK
jgi:hypothetical protein